MAESSGISWTDATKWCSRCKCRHPRADFGADRSRGDGLAASCRRSKNARERSSYVPRPRRPRGQAWRAPARDGDVSQARGRVNYLVRAGVLPDPNDVPCADCAHVHSAGERRHEYDHHLGYGPEHHEDVEAVCTTCHRRRVDVRGELVQVRDEKGRYASTGEVMAERG